jgi:tetratricopeptide (TPR) repeat protein
LRAARADPAIKTVAIRDAWIDFLAAECRHHPVLVVLEDLHWGDRPTVEYVDAALRALAEAPLMVLALARPEVRDQFPKLWSDRELQEIRLPGLTRKASERFVHDVLGTDVGPSTVRRIVERAGGNAFFLEELVRAVAEGHDDLPNSVLSMMQQRLDQLGAEPKRALRAAAVFGDVFWRGGVAALVGDDHEQHLETLLERELIAVNPVSRLSDETEYVFRHDLVREAAYATTGDADRTLAHRLAGEWLVAHGFSDAAALAGHFSLGNEPLRAAEFYARAADQANAGNDKVGALQYADRGLTCGPTGDVAGRLHLARAEGFNWRGEHGLASDAAASAVAALGHGSADWFRAHDELFYAVGRLGEMARAMLVMRDLIAAEAGPDAALYQLRSIARAAIVMHWFGPPDVATTLHLRAEELAGTITIDPSTDQRLQSLRGVAARNRGHVDAALAAHEAAVKLCEATHNVRELPLKYWSLGVTYDEIGVPDRAILPLTRGLEVAERVAVGTVSMLLYVQLARTQWHLHRYDDARAIARKALAACGENDRWVAGSCGFVLANIALECGELDDARSEIERALDRFGTSVIEGRALALATLARIQIARGIIAPAREAATEARTILRPQNGFQDGESLVRLVEVEALEAAGERAAALAAADVAIARLDHRVTAIDENWRGSFVGRPENAATLSRRR